MLLYTSMRKSLTLKRRQLLPQQMMYRLMEMVKVRQRVRLMLLPTLYAKVLSRPLAVEDTRGKTRKTNADAAGMCFVAIIVLVQFQLFLCMPHLCQPAESNVMPCDISQDQHHRLQSLP